MDNHVEFARIHTAFMGGFEPARMLIWAPDTNDSTNWHHEEPMDVQNLTMLLSMGGLIHIRKGDLCESAIFIGGQGFGVAGDMGNLPAEETTTRDGGFHFKSLLTL